MSKVVYIDGLEMPKNCGECPLYNTDVLIDPRGEIWREYYCGDKQYFRMDKSVRQIGCPLREIEVKE